MTKEERICYYCKEVLNPHLKGKYHKNICQPIPIKLFCDLECLRKWADEVSNYE